MEAMDYRKTLQTASVVRMPVLQDDVSLFDLIPNCTFKIPLYQRAFAWGAPPHEVNENELVCLMDDICGAAESPSDYYIGSVVVNAEERDGQLECEVIDGQQRLTALFILLNSMGIEINAPKPLDYAERNRSFRAIGQIEEIVRYAKALLNKEIAPECAVRQAGKGDVEQFKVGDWMIGTEALENSICNGVVAVLRHLSTGDKNHRDDYEECLRRGLSKVRLYLVKVPEKTDLNRYFEVMNTRGEQLEPQDIVKAMLMRQLTDIKKRELFAEIWNACSDMNGYVQMHFPVGLRDQIFGVQWTDMPHVEIEECGEIADEVEMSICESLLKGEVKNESANQNAANDASGEPAERTDAPMRFKSVIYFPHFLLNVLRVFNHANGEPILDEKSELDVSKMIRNFKKLFFVQNEPLTEERKAEVSWNFAKCLLTCRFLFDKYIVKRDYERDAVDGEWSIKQLRQSGTGSDRTAYYAISDEQGDENAAKRAAREKVLMLQTCLRVTYTEFKGMHWVTTLLDWLYRNREGVEFDAYVREAEKIACVAAKNGVDMLKSENFRMGTSTPHIVFNYLDYLLWEDAKGKRQFMTDGGWLKPFNFAYRNSVEHWYPQHPEGLEAWDVRDEGGRRAVDQFGNLCVVQPSENSKFSNLRPKAKKDQYLERTISKGSLKLRLMANQTVDANEIQWKQQCTSHGKEMLAILEKAFQRVLGINSTGKVN